MLKNRLNWPGRYNLGYLNSDEFAETAYALTLYLLQAVSVVHVLVKGPHRQNWEGSEEEIVAGDEDSVEDGLEVGKNGKRLLHRLL